MVTPYASGNFDAKIIGLVQRDQEVTLKSLGGIGGISFDCLDSPMFPYAAGAIVTSWSTLSDDEHARATDLLSGSITRATSALALNDTCRHVVPIAADIGIDLALKDALRHRVAARSIPSTGGLPAVALRWLGHLAVTTDVARPALVDLLTGIAHQPMEPTLFAVAAAQVAGLVYDHWREPAAKACLNRLTRTGAEPDAWFALGQTQLVDAFEGQDKESVVAGLVKALRSFEYVGTSGERRADAALYVHIIRFVSELVSNAPIEMLQPHIERAEEALHEYILAGRGLPDQPMWLRPRYEAENEWIVVVRHLRRALDSGPNGHPWYEPAIVISALSEAYCAANSLRPRRNNASTTTMAFPDLVAPRLSAPFLSDANRLAFVDVWLRDSDDPNAEEFARVVKCAASVHIDGDDADSHVMSPK